MPQNPIKTSLYVSQILAGSDITITPTHGTGIVTVNATGSVYNPSAVAITGGTVEGITTLSGTGVTSAVEAVVAAQILTTKQTIRAPLVADLISVVNAVTPSNVALTIAAQPPHARKLNIRIVIGTSPTTAITAGTLALVGVNQDGDAVTENISMITTTNVTLKSANAYAKLTSATVSAYAASGSGTGNTIGLGAAPDFGISTGQGTIGNFACIKETAITTTVTGSVTAWSVVATDEPLTGGGFVVDTAARTVAPYTPPSSSGLIDYEIICNYSLAA